MVTRLSRYSNDGVVRRMDGRGRSEGGTGPGGTLAREPRLAAEVEAAVAASGALFRDGPMPMWLFDVDTLRIIAVNDAAVRAYGYSRDEFLAMTIRELRRPDDTPADLGRMPRTGDGLVLRGPYRHRRRDGSLLDAEVHVQDLPPLADGRRTRLVVSIDVSARRRAETRERFLADVAHALGASLDFERTVQRIAQLAIEHLADGCTVHLRAGDGGAELHAVASRDPRWARRLRALEPRPPRAAPPATVGPAVVLATGRPEFHQDLAADAAATPDDPTLASWRRIGIESCMCLPLHAPGREEPVGVLSLASLASGRRFDASDLAMATDLARHASLAIENARLYAAERAARRTAERLAVQHARLQQITAALAHTLTVAEIADVVVSEGVAALGARAGSVALLSEDGASLEVVQATGYAPELVAAYRAMPLAAPLPLTDAVRRREAVWLDGVADRDRRYPHLASVRRASDGAMAAVPLLVEGAVLGALGLTFADDATLDEEDRAFALTLASQCAQAIVRSRLHDAERRARAAIEAARLEAEAANRTKTEFLAVMSHELRTPLNAIAGYAELMEMGIRGPVTGEQQEDLRRIRRSQQHLLGLINDVLNFAKLETGAVRYEIVDLPVHEVLEGVEPLIAPQLAAKQLRCEFGHARSGLLVRADRDKLQQILLNLLSNAVKFTDAGGRIAVDCEPCDGQVRLRVADTGIGIPPDRMEAIFEPFVQLDQRLTRTTEGTGLGLAISRDLARAMGGELTVRSVVGEGSEFVLVLPAGHG